ncbi:hypothetical protein B0H13DRAFT_2288627 [Mycena leptocephala]|nr:hypothetical protein B0H13DRAFT_2288627 [Mycena leptocephala]
MSAHEIGGQGGFAVAGLHAARPQPHLCIVLSGRMGGDGGSIGDNKETRIDLAVSSVCGRTSAEDGRTVQIGDRGDVAGGGMALGVRSGRGMGGRELGRHLRAGAPASHAVGLVAQDRAKAHSTSSKVWSGYVGSRRIGCGVLVLETAAGAAGSRDTWHRQCCSTSGTDSAEGVGDAKACAAIPWWDMTELGVAAEDGTGQWIVGQTRLGTVDETVEVILQYGGQGSGNDGDTAEGGG